MLIIFGRPAVPPPHPTPPPHPEQEALARGQRQVTEEVYAGTYAYASYAPFSQTVPESKVGLDTFKYVSSLVSEWAWKVVGRWCGRVLNGGRGQGP